VQKKIVLALNLFVVVSFCGKDNPTDNYENLDYFYTNTGNH
jgi:hypothetical protein